MNHDFLESQVGAAELNKFKLDNRHEELSENIKTLKSEIEETEKQRQQTEAENPIEEERPESPPQEVTKNLFRNHIGENLFGDEYYD